MALQLCFLTVRITRPPYTRIVGPCSFVITCLSSGPGRTRLLVPRMDDLMGRVQADRVLSKHLSLVFPSFHPKQGKN